MLTVRKLKLLPIPVILVLLPFFEGGETSFGVFLLHTLILFGFTICTLFYGRLVVPRLLATFLPFLLVLLVSTTLSDYKFAAFLKFWDFAMAGVWAVFLCTMFYQNKHEFDALSSWMFVALAASTITAILIYNTSRIMRISASFVNPNDYATFALVLSCFGLYCFEQEILQWRKTVVLTLLIVLLTSLAFSLSRGIFVAILVMVIVVLLKHRPSKIISGTLIGLLILTAMMIVLRFRMYDDPLKYYRLKIWRSSVQGVIDSPYLGVGLGMLEYHSSRFNFPADVDIGRYGKIARSADDQYVQILAETGFLGFLSFAFWWIALFLLVRKFSRRFFYAGLPWLVLSVTCLFSLPLQNTSIVLLSFFLLVVGETLDAEQKLIVLNLTRPLRIAVPVLVFLAFVFLVDLPYFADREFHLATQSRTRTEADKHLMKAVRYNPYQPYYRFAFIRPIVDARPELSEDKWIKILGMLDESISLNPQEYQFHLYKARVLRAFILKKQSLQLYPAVVSSYQNALDCNPYNVFLRLEFASFLARFGRYDLAQSEVRKSLEIEPAFLNGRLFLTEMLCKLNRTGEAKAEYQRFQQDVARFQNRLAVAPTSYIRELLTINQKQKQRVEELMRNS